MRVVFMGTPEFAVPSLRALHETHEVAAVYTRPDARAGRGRKVTYSAVKSFAASAGLPIMQPDRFGAQDVDDLTALGPDALCVAAYGTILPKEVLDVPVHGALNVHASLLPSYRGAAPIERAILSGDSQTGVSIMFMEASLDTGPVALRRTLSLGEMDAMTATTALSEIGAEALLEVLARMEKGPVSWEPQDESSATYAKKIDRSEVALDPALDVTTLLRRVRASSRRAPSSALVCGDRVTVLEARRSDVPVARGKVYTGPEGLLLGADDGSLRIVRLKPESRSAMTADAFVCGLKDTSSDWAAL